MSINDIKIMQQTLIEATREPKAWVLLANPVWGRTEDVNKIALFDTLEQAKAYFEASKLKIKATTPDGIHRTFRPDSLLYDYNEISEDFGPTYIAMVPWVIYDTGLAENPIPPSGDDEEMVFTNLTKPRYGKDYDVGWGGVKTDVSNVIPTET